MARNSLKFCKKKKKRKEICLKEINWKKKLKEKKIKSQHAFERKWPPVFFGKFTGQYIERFLKKKCVRLKGGLLVDEYD